MADILLATTGEDAGAVIVLFFYLALVVFLVAAMWATFAKAGQPGWAAIIPIYNMYALCQMAGRPGWWIVLLFVPLVNIILWVIVMIDVARAFGKGTGFGLGLCFLGFIFFPILGFGQARYEGPSR